MYFSVSEGGRRRSVPIAQVADLAPGVLNKGSYFQRGADEAGRLCLRGQVGGQRRVVCEAWGGASGVCCIAHYANPRGWRLSVAQPMRGLVVPGVGGGGPDGRCFFIKANILLQSKVTSLGPAYLPLSPVAPSSSPPSASRTAGGVPSSGGGVEVVEVVVTGTALTLRVPRAQSPLAPALPCLLPPSRGPIPARPPDTFPTVRPSSSSTLPLSLPPQYKEMHSPQAAIALDLTVEFAQCVFHSFETTIKFMNS
ncbi:hypothetical protein E2C01_009899 [Portunus trituberculatus]|uniref:Uncharacterized protein n=1 Tax=Portunus trituberculatus TaxID=210409 RepID=A0A5B7D708_PORTR|nr:hypothetical protein [Portunus trituberculatus]